MTKVLIIGPPGAGKSTFARELGDLLALEVIHIDRLYWNAGWVETPEEEFRDRVSRAVEGEAWVIDGNYSKTFDIRMPAADTIVFLDFPRWRCLARAFKRIATYYGRTRPDMAPGCRERFDPAFIKWIWDYPKRSYASTVRLLVEQAGLGKPVFTLRTPAEVAGFLEDVRMNSITDREEVHYGN